MGHHGAAQMAGREMMPLATRLSPRPTLSNFGSMVPRAAGPVVQADTLAQSARAFCGQGDLVPLSARGSPRVQTRSQIDSLLSMQWPGAASAQLAQSGQGQSLRSSVSGGLQASPRVQASPQLKASPRLSPRQLPRDNCRGPNSARAGPPLTLGSLGAMLPRPAPAQAGSPRVVARGAAERAEPPLPAATGKSERASAAVAADARSSNGVVYERDGFEMFYGLSTGEGDTASPAKTKADGYDKFYGIRQKDRCAKDHLRASAPSLPGMCDPGQPPGQVLEGTQTMLSCRPAIRRPELSACEEDMKEVQTFSVATPAAPSMPPMISSVPNGVDVFSLATPMPPPPEGLRAGLC